MNIGFLAHQNIRFSNGFAYIAVRTLLKPEGNPRTTAFSFCLLTVSDDHTKPRFKKKQVLNKKTAHAPNCV